MEIKPIVVVPDHETINDKQKLISSNVLEAINSVANTTKYSKSCRELFLYVLIREKRSSDKVKMLCDGLYFGANIDESIEGSSFTTVIKNALRKDIKIIPVEERNCIAYLSINEFNPASLFQDPLPATGKLLFEAVDPIFTLDEVVMQPDERQAVMRAITLIKKQTLIYDKWGFAAIDKSKKSVICFHGVPGTGKTMCAHGVASYLGKKIIIGSYAQIESEFVGVGAKNLVQIFKAAEEQGAVLFIDEADTFLSRRLPASNDSSKHYNSMSNELYKLIENFNGCIIFASNHIKDFDPAVISRIIEPIEFKLPDYEGRKAILKNMFRSSFPLKGGVNENVLDALSSASEGFSGRDIRKAIQISLADIAYRYSPEGDVDVVAQPELMDYLRCFDEVRQARNLIESKTRRSTSDLLKSFEQVESKNSRIIQLAAHTLLADGKVEPREKRLFEHLEKILNTSCPLDVELLPKLSSICSEVETNGERSELVEVVCRMSAIDCDVHENEINILKEVCQLLDIPESLLPRIIEYCYRLASDYTIWTEITQALGISDSEILSKLREEYSEGASYFRLSQYYREGSPLFGGISPNSKKAEKYEQLAKESGYIKK